MLLNKWRHLSFNQKQLLRFLLVLWLVSLVLGFVSGLIHWATKRDGRATLWEQSEYAGLDSTAKEYALVSQDMWYKDPAVAAQQDDENKKKTLSGSPEGFTLIGIVERKSKMVALFMPSKSTGAAQVKNLSQGDQLVGDWKVQTVEKGQVILVAESENEPAKSVTVKLYDFKDKAKKN